MDEKKNRVSFPKLFIRDDNYSVSDFDSFLLFLLKYVSVFLDRRILKTIFLLNTYVIDEDTDCVSCSKLERHGVERVDMFGFFFLVNLIEVSTKL